MKPTKSIAIFVVAICILTAIAAAIVIKSNNTVQPMIIESDIFNLSVTTPKVDTKGICHPEPASNRNLSEYEMYFSENDVTALAQMLWGEARGCSIENQIKACWCVLNRVDDSRFPNTIISVVSSPNQFHGYSQNFPVWDNLKDVARDVLIRWSLEKQGVCVNRELPKSYLWFTGNGVENIFREAY